MARRPPKRLPKDVIAVVSTISPLTGRAIKTVRVKATSAAQLSQSGRTGGRR